MKSIDSEGGRKGPRLLAWDTTVLRCLSTGIPGCRSIFLAAILKIFRKIIRWLWAQSSMHSVVTPTNSRSLVATRIDLTYALKLRLAQDPDVNLIALALWLMDYRAPNAVTRQLVR